jgi:cleavage and polyadenylation specificity factor subunit 1
VLQQRVNNTWQPLAFFSRKLNPAQQKYSAYDRELLAVYEAVKHFRHMLEARHFIIFTDHKPITYAFQQKRYKCSLRQFNHLDFISQFSTDVRHISGQDNVVADNDELRTLLG